MPTIDGMTSPLATSIPVAETPLDYRAIFARAAHLLAGVGDFREALEQTLAACLPELGDFGFFDAIDGDGALRVARAHEDERVEAILRPTRWIRQERSDMNLCALSTGRPALHPDIDDAWYQRVAANEQHLAILRDLGFRSMITVPMRFKEELIGSLTLFMGRSGRRHRGAHLELAADIAAMAAPVVANARLWEGHQRTVEALRASEERMRLAQLAAGVGAWDWNVTTNEVYWSPQYRDIYGFTPDQAPSFEAGMAVVPLEDRDQVAGELARAIEAKSEFRSLQRIDHPHRGRRWIEAIGKATYDDRGLPVRVTGVVMDVTERQRTSDETQALRDLLGAELQALRRLHELTLRTARRDEPLERLLEEILAAALETAGQLRGAIHLLDSERGCLILAASQGFPPEFCERMREVPLAEALTSAHAVRRRERVIVADIMTGLAGSPYLDALLRMGVRSVQSTPLIGRDGEAIGTFSTHSGVPGGPKERELRLLDMLSRTAADLIEWGRADR